MNNVWIAKSKESIIEISGLKPISITNALKGYAVYYPITEGTHRYLLDINPTKISNTDLLVLEKSRNQIVQIKIMNNPKINVKLTNVLNTGATLRRYIFEVVET